LVAAAGWRALDPNVCAPDSSICVAPGTGVSE
jgi:hypothetical protein